MVVILQTITSYSPVDIPQTKSLTQNILTWIPTHCFDKNMIDQSTGVEPSLNPATHVKISLLLILVLGSISDLRDNKDILPMMGFNYNFLPLLRKNLGTKISGN